MRTLSRRVLEGLSVQAAAAAGSTVAVAHAATGACRVDHAVSNQWPGRFGANVTITNLFIWTGAAYLGEADGLWPNVESDFGLIDAVGTVRPIGYSWQKAWARPSPHHRRPVRPPTSCCSPPITPQCPPTAMTSPM